MSDLVKRLRTREGVGAAISRTAATTKYLYLVMDEAADELARLRSEVERLTRERDEAQAGWKTASELLDAAVGDYNTEHVALTALTARTREVLAPFAEWFPEEALRRVPPDQRLMTTGLEARHFRAANTLFNELKEKVNGMTTIIYPLVEC